MYHPKLLPKHVLSTEVRTILSRIMIISFLKTVHKIQPDVLAKSLPLFYLLNYPENSKPPTGSVNGGNSAELAKKEDIDGFLVGGASLKVTKLSSRITE